MRTLILLRHAKSDWTTAGLDDFDRPLAMRGRKAATLMGRYMQTKRLMPDLVLCSSAERSRQTWDIMVPEISETPDVRFLKSLYLAPPSRLLVIIQRTPKDVKRLMLIGHNPGMENLAKKLSDSGKKKALKTLTDKFPTAALAVIRFEADDWADIAERTGILTSFVRPKDVSQGRGPAKMRA